MVAVCFESSWRTRSNVERVADSGEVLVAAVFVASAKKESGLFLYKRLLELSTSKLGIQTA